jgi:hypothetical protein
MNVFGHAYGQGYPFDLSLEAHKARVRKLIFHGNGSRMARIFGKDWKNFR